MDEKTYHCAFTQTYFRLSVKCDPSGDKVGFDEKTYPRVDCIRESYNTPVLFLDRELLDVRFLPMPKQTELIL